MSSEASDPYRALRAAAAGKSARAMAAAKRALMVLEARGVPINFKTVAAEAGVSKGYLYSNLELRNLIAERRTSPPHRPVVPGKAAQNAHESGAATKVEALVREIRALRAEIAQLRQENQRLRGDLMDRR